MSLCRHVSCCSELHQNSEHLDSFVFIFASIGHFSHRASYISMSLYVNSGSNGFSWKGLPQNSNVIFSMHFSFQYFLPCVLFRNTIFLHLFDVSTYTTWSV